MSSEPENPVTTMDCSWIIRILPFIPKLCSGPICELKDNLITLRHSIEGLKDTRNYIRERVDTLEANGMKRTPIVAGWLERADAMEEEVEGMLREGHEDIQDRFLGGFCPWNCCASYRLGSRVDLKIREVNGHKVDGRNFNTLAEPLPPVPVQEMPITPTTGMDLMFRKAWDCISEETAGIIGLYGIGGVGKTTLLEKIKHEFLNRVAPNDYEVIWVHVPPKATALDIQKKVANILKLPPTDATLEERAPHIHQKLIQKKFALLLDDIRDLVDLRAIGIPYADAINKSKVVFTTRLESVCGRMTARRNASKVRVECLDWPDAWTLFKENVGEAILNSHDEIPEIAMKVAKKCAGLPLALIITGRAMSCKTTPEAWNHVADNLIIAASEFSFMGDEVYPILKVSYDSLDNTAQSCFLYCSLFPVDHSIEIDQLIRYWIGEGFLTGFNSMDAARKKGYFIVGTLKEACLLDSSQSEKVLMHDVLRGLALWIGCESGKKRDKYLVRAGDLSHETPEVEKWGEATRISLMNNCIQTLGDTAPTCPALSTLIISGNIYLTNIPNAFFQYMKVLRVLDLSGTKICNFPNSIVQLINLQYLGLARTAIEFIPCGILPAFKKLQVLDLEESIFGQWEAENCGGQDDRNHGASIEELERLNALKFLSINISNSAALTRLLGSDNFTRCSIQLSLRRCSDLISFQLPTKESFRNGCLHRLRKVHIFSCASLKDLKWIRGAVDLESLDVRNCEALELICDDEDAPKTFSRLRSLTLINLPELNSIPSHLFPSNTIVTKQNCPKLPR